MTGGLGLRTLAGNIAGVGGRQLATSIIQLGTVVLVARIFGPEGNGRIALAWLLPTTLTLLLNLGLTPANVYFLSSGRVGSRSVLRTSLRIGALLGLAGLAIGAVLITWVGDQVFPGVGPELLWIALAAFPASLLQALLASILHGLQRFRALNLLLLAHPVLLLLMVAGGLLAGSRSLTSVVVAYTVASWITLLVTWVVLRPIVTAEGQGALDVRYTRDAVSYGMRAHGGNIIAFINQKIDVFLVNVLLNPGAAGLYVVAVSIAEKLWFLARASSVVLLPRISELVTDEEKRRRLTPFATRWVLLLTVVGAVLLAVVAVVLFPFLFGDRFLGSIVPLWLMLPGIVVAAASQVLANDIAARGRPGLNSHTSVVAVFVNVVGSLILIPRYGIEGAAVATTLAYGTNLMLKLVIFRKLTGVPVIRVLLPEADDFRLIARVLRRERG